MFTLTPNPVKKKPTSEQAYNSKRGRIYYATQVATEPPQSLSFS